jgi:23S rRNA maturation-related 3'-5' exoribonuclease YhaM
MNHTVIDIKDPVIKSVIHKIASRSNVGVAKYGTTLEESKEGHVAFLTHLQEELMDAINYIEKLKEFYGVLSQDPSSSNTESI